MLAASAALAAALALAASAATAQTAPAAKAAAQAVAQPPGAPPPAPQAAGGVLVPSSGFRYDPTGRRDPFKSLLQLEKKQRDIATLPPIQQFDLETVKVVGIVVDPGRAPQAMIKAPNGQTFVVKPGTILGKNEGEVVEITMQGIRVVEKFLDFMNRETRKETFLKSHPAAVR
ncbi:MAG TPA: pilus assembly protein PilP [Candidatus Methanoperedens sp.]|nr:pilus assembly protein PilP [Candidatus Methanoperedens sp.]